MLADLSIAVTGATGLSGRALRDSLAERKVPVDRVRLLEEAAGEAILSEYAGQAVLIGALDPDAIADRDVVFLCGGSEEADRCSSWPHKRGALLVDLSGAGSMRGDPVVHALVTAAPAARSGRVSVPHPVSWGLSTALAPLDREFGVEDGRAVVLLPASDFGEAGVEELHRQTVGLLNFGAWPKQVFGRQIAFNLVPASGLKAGLVAPGLERRIADEIASVLGWEEPRLSVVLLVAPVFHGHAAALQVRFRLPPGKGGLDRAIYRDGRIASARAGGILSPVDAQERDGVFVAGLATGDPTGLDRWLWVVGADLSRSAAMNAVDVVERLVAS